MDTGTEHERFERLFEHHENRIRAYCARRLPPADVDDAVAETFSVAWRKFVDAPDADDALPWLYAVAYRVVQHHWRGAGRFDRLRRRATATSDRSEVDVADEFIADDDRRRVVLAALRLDAHDQEILRLTLWEEITPTAAATVLGISPDAAKQRARRARRRLAEEFHRSARVRTADDARIERSGT